MNRSDRIRKTASAVAEIARLEQIVKILKVKIASDSENMNICKEKLEYTQNNLKQSEAELYALSDELERLEGRNNCIKLWIGIAWWVVLLEALVITTLILTHK